MPTITLSPKKVLKILVGLSLAFVAINLCRMPWHHVFGERLQHIWMRFNVDFEDSIPTWFSTMVLMAGAVALAFIAVEKRKLRDRFARHWVGLAVIFMFLSMDEIAGLHEMLGARMKEMNLNGPLFFAWVIPVGALVLIFIITYLRFLFSLSKTFCILFVVSGAVYVFGALVMETVGGQINKAYGDGVLYMLAVTAEEGCEMLGASLFVYTQLRYLQAMAGQCVLRLVDPEAVRNELPPSPSAAPH